jgi:hypothetical protein
MRQISRTAVGSPQQDFSQLLRAPRRLGLAEQPAEQMGSYLMVSAYERLGCLQLQRLFLKDSILVNDWAVWRSSSKGTLPQWLASAEQSRASEQLQ